VSRRRPTPSTNANDVDPETTRLRPLLLTKPLVSLLARIKPRPSNQTWRIHLGRWSMINTAGTLPCLRANSASYACKCFLSDDMSCV
jgi:hypothetical protein